MSRHHPDLVMCRKQSGIAIGRLCDKCDGKCPVCDSYVRPTTLVRICDECSFGNYQNKCVVCGGEGISDAFYCYECTRLEKDRDGCPKIINLGSSRTDVCFSAALVARPAQVMHILTFALQYSYSTKRKRIGKQIISQAVARVWAGQLRWIIKNGKTIYHFRINHTYG
ncbi:PHF5-like domain-containing protein [Trichoderma sp. SZMC 28014]